MRGLLSLFLSLLIGLGEPAWADAGQVHHSQRPMRVSGVLILHWEYPHFITTIGNSERVFEFEILDQRWLGKNGSLMMTNPVSSGEYVCVEGRGYEDRARLGSTGRTTFMFTKIIGAVKVDTPERCGNRGAR